MQPTTRKFVFHKSQQFTGWACTVCEWAQPIPRVKFGGDVPGNIETDFANHKYAKYPRKLASDVNLRSPAVERADSGSRRTAQ
jgi:hypothetical protein